MQNFLRSNWLRTMSINPKQCRKLKLSAKKMKLKMIDNYVIAERISSHAETKWQTNMKQQYSNSITEF